MSIFEIVGIFYAILWHGPGIIVAPIAWWVMTKRGFRLKWKLIWVAGLLLLFWPSAFMLRHILFVNLHLNQTMEEWHDIMREVPYRLREKRYNPYDEFDTDR